MNIDPTECPKWESCSAAVCPLNRTGKHLKDERICFYAKEFVKEGSKERFAAKSLEWLYDVMAENFGWLVKQSADIKKRLTRSALTSTILIKAA